MSIFLAGAISIMSPLVVMLIFISWRATDKNKPTKQRAKEVLIESIKLAIVVMVSIAASSVIFQMVIRFLIK
ncbi:hypothetical protein D3C81_1900810 [compost metagenome]